MVSGFLTLLLLIGGASAHAEVSAPAKAAVTVTTIPAVVIPARAPISNADLDMKLGRIENILKTGHPPSLARVRADWKELQTFHRELWRTMALDPGSLPIREVPKHLQSQALSDELEKRFEALSTSVLIQRFALEEPFAEYVDVVSQILALRREQKFITARSLAKRGLLDDAYQDLQAALEAAQQADEALVLPLMSPETERELRDTLISLRGAPPIVAQAAALHAPEVNAAPVAVAHAAPETPAVAPAPPSAAVPLSRSTAIFWTLLGFVFALPIGALIHRAITDTSDAEAVSDSRSGALQFAPGFDFGDWLKAYRNLMTDYRKLRSEGTASLRQSQPFLEDSSRFILKYCQETRESRFRSGFSDLQLAMNELVEGLTGSLQSSDQYSRGLMSHLSVLAEALHTGAARKTTSPKPTPVKKSA
jgi:hypothetical protein